MGRAKLILSMLVLTHVGNILWAGEWKRLTLSNGSPIIYGEKSLAYRAKDIRVPATVTSESGFENCPTRNLLTYPIGAPYSGLLTTFDS